MKVTIMRVAKPELSKVRGAITCGSDIANYIPRLKVDYFSL
jgi:hypothetical protein